MKPRRRRGRRPRLRVGAASARALDRGHPWIIADAHTGPTGALRSGDVVDLVGPGGAPLAAAIVDPGRRVVARVVGAPGSPFDPAERARGALARRRALVDDDRTDAYRLVHGEADGLPGLEVDRYGSALVAVVRAPLARTFAPAVLDVLGRATGCGAAWLKEHLEDLRKAPVRGRCLAGGLGEDDEVVVRERGLAIHARPFAGLATGLFTDQRGNRALLCREGPFDHALNLFAYTGVFSAALLAAGTVRVTSVDLSRPALRLAERNVAANGIDADRHRVVRADVRRHLARDRAEYDLIIVDPPTAARGGRGWSARRGYDELLDQVLARLSPGGTLLACLNDRSARAGRLEDLVRAAAARAGRRVARLRRVGPGPDYPILDGFPESRSFQGVVLRTS